VAQGYLTEMDRAQNLELFELFLSHKKLVLGRLQAFWCFPSFTHKKMSTPKYFRAVKYFTARWSRENGPVKKKLGRQMAILGEWFFSLGQMTIVCNTTARIVPLLSHGLASP
jgi:hypothetical protein